MAALSRRMPQSTRPGLVAGIATGWLIGVGLVALGTYGVVNDWGDSTAESTRTVAISATGSFVVAFLLYRVGFHGLDRGAASTAARAATIGGLAATSGVVLFWSGVWGPFGAAALILGSAAAPHSDGQPRRLAVAGAVLGLVGLTAGIALSLLA